MDGGKQWSHLLPKDLLVMIVKRLKSRIYVVRLLAVCKSWRSSLLSFLEEEKLQYSPLKIPLLIPPDYPINEIPVGFITISESTVYCIEPSQQNLKASVGRKASSSSSFKGILVEVEDEGPDKLRRLSHLSALQERQHKKFAEELNLLELRFTEISKVYRTRSDTLFNNDGSIVRLPRIKKIAILSSNSRRATADSFVVMAIFNPGRLWFLKSGEEKWTTIHELHSNYTDVIACKGKFYAITDNGAAIVIDSFLNVTKIASPLQGHGFGHQKYLVDSFGDMLMVSGIFGDRVSKLDEVKREWVDMTSLGDRVLFVDEHCTFSVSTREFTACKGNCIFTRYMEVFNLEDRRWQGLDECFLGVSLEGVGGISLSLDVSHVRGLSWALVNTKLSNAECIGKKKKKKKKEKERKKRRKKKQRGWW